MTSSLLSTDYGSSLNALVANAYSQINTFGTRIYLTDSPQSWHQAVIEQLKKLMQLEVGWDGYEARPVAFENAIFALRLLESVCRDDAPTPHIIPGLDGDLQLEWHSINGEIELHVRSPNEVYAWHSRLDNVDEEEVRLTFDFTDVAIWVQKITEPAIALRAATA